MAITDSIGYGGTVTEDDLPRWRRSFAGTYGVVDPGDWKVTLKAGTDRTLRVAAGDGYGHAVIDTNDGTATGAEVTLATLSSGTRYDLIVARRDWSGTGGTTTFDKVTGTSSSVAAFASRNQSPGTAIDDQPLAIVTVQGSGTGGSVTAVTDARVWQTDSGAVGASTAVLQYLNEVGTEIRIGSVIYTRVPDGLGGSAWDTRQVGIVEYPLTLASGWSDSTVSLLVVDGQIAHLDGALIRNAGATTSASADDLTVIPVAARPIRKITVPVSVSFSTTAASPAGVGHLRIGTDGRVSWANPTGVSAAVWHVGAICWPVA